MDGTRNLRGMCHDADPLFRIPAMNNYRSPEMTFPPSSTFTFTDEMISRMDACVLCWLATVSSEGIPNVSPKEMFLRDGTDRLLIAYIASPVSAQNIRSNPNVCVSMADILVQKGYKFTGTARIIGRTDVEYPHAVEKLTEHYGTRFAIPSVLEITIRSAEPIIAPSYRFFPDSTTEQGQIDQAMIRYNILPRPQ